MIFPTTLPVLLRLRLRLAVRLRVEKSTVRSAPQVGRVPPQLAAASQLPPLALVQVATWARAPAASSNTSDGKRMKLVLMAATGRPGWGSPTLMVPDRAAAGNSPGKNLLRAKKTQIALSRRRGRCLIGAMERLSRRTLAERAEDQLAAAIGRGELAGRLPGYRELCRVFGISRTSLEPALAALVGRGLLAARGARRCYEVAAGAAVRVPGLVPGRKLLLLEPTLPGRPTPVVRRVADALRKRLEGSPWALTERYVALDQSRRAGRRLAAILKAEQPDFTVLVGGHAATVAWFDESGRPFGCFGGDLGGRALPLVTFDSSGMLGTVLRHHLAAGRRDPFVPLRVRTPGLVEKARATVAQALAGAGLAFSPAWHTPVLRENSAAAMREAAAARLARRVPDLWVCYGDDMLVGAMGELARHGLRLPAQVDLALLGPADDLPWLPPWIGAFRFPVAPVVAVLLRWLHHGGRDPGAETIRLQPAWQPGTRPGG
jgi:hypothetical protein